MSDEIITENTTEEVTFEKAAPVANATGNPGVSRERWCSDYRALFRLHWCRWCRPTKRWRCN